jgi:hypothetical protein
MMEDGLKKIEQYFHAKARVGIIPSHSELVDFAARKGIPLDSKLSRSLRQMRHRWKFVAVFSKPKKISHYMGFMVPRYGMLMIDLGYYSFHETAGEEETGPTKMRTRSSQPETRRPIGKPVPPGT